MSPLRHALVLLLGAALCAGVTEWAVGAETYRGVTVSPSANPVPVLRCGPTLPGGAQVCAWTVPGGQPVLWPWELEGIKRA